MIRRSFLRTIFALPLASFLRASKPHTDVGYADVFSCDRTRYIPYLNGTPVVWCQVASADEGWVDVISRGNGFELKRFYGQVQIFKETPQHRKAFDEAEKNGSGYLA